MPVTGNLFPFIDGQAQRGLPSLSFLQDVFTDAAAWRAQTVEYLRSLLLFQPEAVDLSPELADETDYPDYIQQKWYITPVVGERMPVILLVPRMLANPAPAVLALHCHGGMYYFGKKKLVEEPNEPAIITAYRQQRYGGTAIANELVRRGYVVAVSDAFYFGERRLVTPTPADMVDDFLLAGEGSEQWLALLDRVSARMEDPVAKSLTWAGITWPGVQAWDDQRVVDFLASRPEVDTTRLGCLGLGLGGFRSALLGALDPRVKATCVVGWMSLLADMLDDAVGRQSWMTFIPGLVRVLDWPDLAGLHAPDPLLVMQGGQDPYFPLNGFQKAAERLRAIYAKAGAPGNFDVGLFDLPHVFAPEMQQHAWAFFDAAFGVASEGGETP